MQNPDEAIEQYQLAKKDRTMNSEQEKLFDAIADWKSNDDWQFADKEAAWKFFFQAGAASRDAEIARLKTVPMRYRRMAFNAQLQDEVARLEQENDQLRVQIKQKDAEIAELVTALKPFGAIDLVESRVPAEFAMLVLRARAAIDKVRKP